MIAKASKRSFSNYKSAALPAELCRRTKKVKTLKELHCYNVWQGNDCAEKEMPLPFVGEAVCFARDANRVPRRLPARLHATGHVPGAPSQRQSMKSIVRMSNAVSADATLWMAPAVTYSTAALPFR